MNLNEMKQVINLLDKEWDLGKKNSQAKEQIVLEFIFLKLWKNVKKNYQIKKIISVVIVGRNWICM